MKKTKVLFYKDENGEVFAYFPELVFDNKGNKTCYAHIGQHSACSPDYVNDKTPAMYNEYQDLLRELIGQGYKDLFIETDQATTYHREPTAWEVKQGYGATHYLGLNMGEVINEKTGAIKSRIKYENLIYTR